MATYKLAAVIHEPSESTEPDKYMAEVPALPACVAWGETPDDVLDILQPTFPISTLQGVS